MTSEFIMNRINTAHDLIDQGQYNEAVSILKRLKTRIHDEEVIKKIKEWEQVHDETLGKRIEKIRESTKHEVDKQNEMMTQIMNYADSYLSYYDGLTREYDI